MLRRRFGQKTAPERRPGPAGSRPAAPARPGGRPPEPAAEPAAPELLRGGGGRRRPDPQDAELARLTAQVHPLVVKDLDATRVAEIEGPALNRELYEWLDSPAARTAGVPTMTALDRRGVAKLLVDEIKGLGPLEPVLQDHDVSDVLINGPDNAYVERRGRLERIDLYFRDEAHLLQIAQRIAGSIGRRVDEASPMVDARLPDGSRVNIIIPPLALDGTAMSIRRFVMREISLFQMAEQQMLSRAMALMLQIAVQARLNVLVSGGTGAGKTTMMNALSREIPGGERLITIEDAAELQLQQPHVVRLETRAIGAEGTGEVDMQSLLVNTLRMRPDRIIVGEVRGAEVKEMLNAMNTGHPGSMSTLHANNPRDALTRLENMLMMGSGEMPLPALRRQIAGSVDLIVQVERLRSGHRCVTSATAVVGMEEDVIITEELWRRRPGLDSEHVFECSGRQPPWMPRVEAIGRKAELLEAFRMDPRRDEAAGPA